MHLRSGVSGLFSVQEQRFLWAVTVAILLVTSVPYIYGYWITPANKQFMGLMLGIPDHGQYLSWWRAFQSSVLIGNQLTPEPNKPIFFNLQWWILAQVSRWTGLGYAPVYQGFRWLAGGLFLWMSYRLIARFLTDPAQRRIAFLLVAFSSGLGWVLVVLKYTLTRGELLFPLDVYVAEGNSFLCILGYPHFALAGAFIIRALDLVWEGSQKGQVRPLIVAGILALLLGWMHAYDLLLIYSIMAVFTLLIWWWRRVFPGQLFIGAVLAFVLSCSGAIYSVALTTLDPLWKEVLAQFANAGVYTPSPPHLIIVFGFPLVLALGACVALALKKQWSEENLFLVGWFLTGAALNYIPTDFQIHMLNSWQVPMMILATKGLYAFVMPLTHHLCPTISERAKRWLPVLLLVAVLPTNAYLWAWRFVDLARRDYPYYLHRDDMEALRWLAENTSPDDIVLSSLTIGQYVPALSGNRAFLAHWAQTVGFYDKQSRVARFYDATTPDEERIETARAFGVGYVFWGSEERGLGDYRPDSTPWLTPVFTSSEVTIYRVRPAPLP